MSTKIVVYLGPARSGKTHELVSRYRDVLRQRGQRSLWLAPNARTANAVRSRLLADGLDACLSPGVVTFDQLTRSILAATRPRRRPLSRLQQRELLRRVVHTAAGAGRLSLFAAAADRAGFIDLLAEHVQELARRDISPADYRKAGPPHGDARQYAELAHLYSEYIAQLTEHRLVDTDFAHGAARDALAANPEQFKDLQLVVVDGFTDFTRTQHDLLRLLAERGKELLVSLPDDGRPDDAASSRGTRTSFETPPLPLGEGRGEGDSPVTDVPSPCPLPKGEGFETGSGRLSDRSAERPDLFAKAAATLAELRRRHPRLELRRFAPRPSAWPAVDYLAQNIFHHPGKISPPSSDVCDSLERVELIEAAGPEDELSEIARRIKRRLVNESARPGDIAVVFRSLAEVAPRVRAVFDRFGIPYALDSYPSLITAPAVRSLVALLRLDAEDWPFRRVVSVITNNSLAAIDERARQAADWLVRDLQIADGRAKLLERVEGLAGESDAPGDYAARRAAKAQAAKPALNHLAAALDQLPKSATPSEWCESLGRSAAALGLSPFVDAVDFTAWQLIERHFASLERLDAWLGQPPRQWSRRELIRALVDVATHESLPREYDDVGRVQIISAPAARNIEARHVYLAGMSEQAFPMAERAGRLATEADYRFAVRVADQELAAADAALPTRAHDEMLLFYEMLSRAEESLTLSYPALDDKGQTLPPSPYVLEIRRLLGEAGMQRVRRTAPHLSPVPRDASAFSLADWRISAVAKALEGDRRSLAGLLSNESNKQLADSLEAGIRIVHARARGDSFGPAEGLLAGGAVADRLAERFGPQHLWSPSQWETYAACPYKFFQEEVLGLEPLGDLVLETDFARRGSRLHDVLAAFHRRWPEVRADQSHVAEDESAAFLSQLLQVIDERIAASPRGGMDMALLELDRRQIRKWAESHFDHHRKYAGAYTQLGQPLAPSHFEFRFGPPRAGDTDHDPRSTPDAFILDVDGEKIRITGQIDRIDACTIGGKTFFSVIDYKSGKKTSLKREHIESGERLQLPIYVEAAQMLVFGGDATPLAAGYWSMAGGFDAKGALAVVAESVENDNADRWKNVQATVRRLVRRFVDGIRGGEFPVASRDDKCTSYCEFHTVCRVAQIRSLQKTWPPETEEKT